MGSIKLLHLGDVSLTFPLAAALAAWMLAAGAWRNALLWSLLFALAAGVVAATKVAFMGWGCSLPAIGFKAVSGHATGVTAVFPILFYILLYRQNRALRAAGAAAGLGLGALVAVQLVVTAEHTSAEAVAGWVLGALVSFAGLRLVADVEAPRPLLGAAGAVLVFASASWIVGAAPLAYWMMKAALILSGNARAYPWDTGG